MQGFRPAGPALGMPLLFLLLLQGMCGFAGLVWRLKPSLLIRDSPVKLAPGSGWCVLFGAVNAARTAGGEKRKHGNESSFVSSLCHTNRNPKIATPPIFLHHHLTFGPFFFSSFRKPTVVSSNDLTHLYLLSGPPHPGRLYFTSLSPRYYHPSHQSCLSSCGLSSRTLTM